MIGEMDIAGVFVPRVLLTVIVGLILTQVLRAALRPAGFYRFVWHAGLFDTAMFIVLWWATAFLTTGLTPYGPR
jgi:uncharacterized protein DUF1656